MKIYTPEERIKQVFEARSIASSALVETFKTNKLQISERDICDQWLNGIASGTNISPEGWYQPPPGGACVLIGESDNNYVRLNYNSLRDTSTWSRDDIFQDKESLLYVYASPVIKGTGLIGDIGLTLYRGSDPEIREHLVKCLDATVKIALHAEVGMPLRKLFYYAQDVLNALKLSNEASSQGSGIENIGHTIPWSYEEYTEEAEKCFDNGSDAEIRKIISDQRVSINDLATLPIQPTMAFTVEPQIISSTAPLCSFHLIVAFSEGNKVIKPSFDSLFNMFSMNSYLGPMLEPISF